ncbi:MAG: hypothetical protein KGO96_06655 [Elusimicrobia bacterium]|nr:hypothetical protein [Elusimicrobiota bacterium]MDE2425571.1 hypothetical protein [Elusimicrobiota bacterium]
MAKKISTRKPRAKARKPAFKLARAGAGAAALNEDVQQPAEEAALAIDYPKAGESVAAPGYTLRLAAAEAATAVEVSIDGGSWLPCRLSVGYWWYDWSGYAAGPHLLEARLRAADGRWIVAKRRCLVEPI